MNNCIKRLAFAPGFIVSFFLISFAQAQSPESTGSMKLNSLEYLEYQGVNVMLAHDFYPESHQGGVGIIQNGLRVATNGDIRLEPTPGQWQPTPKVGKRIVDKAKQEVSMHMEFPNEEIDRKGFNPIIYPDLKFSYTVRVQPAGKGCRIIVDLDKPLPDEWIGKVGFNMELFPGILFGKSYYMDGQSGIFPRQANGPNYVDQEGEVQIQPMAKGRRLTVAPETERQQMTIEAVHGDPLQLIDGRGKHNNGWFVVRALVQKGATGNAIEWLVTPHAIDGWKAAPVVQISQVGYHPAQQKIAVIELDASDNKIQPVSLLRIRETGGYEAALTATPRSWGKFLRYHYLQFDFSAIQKPGMYVVKYGSCQTEPFQISADVYKRNIWQPTLEYFLPVQMCHMRVNERYRVWHGWCHLDDARMAPVDSNHFDGYIQGPSTLTRFKGGDHVPGLDRGGWHDAGDFDLRVESQAETVQGLARAYEEFKLTYDNTSVDERNRVVEIQVPDGKPDALQQIEHGLLSIMGGYNAMGRLYRGIIEPSKRQYVTLGDAANITDNIPFKETTNPPVIGLPGADDDRWVFTENNPGRELGVAAALATAARVLKGYNDSLAAQCLQIAEALWDHTKEENPVVRIEAAVELLLTSKDKKYAGFLIAHTRDIVNGFEHIGWIAGTVMNEINDKGYTEALTQAAKDYYTKVVAQGKKTPYEVPYEPNIWGAGWGIQNFGFHQYYLHKAFPAIFPSNYMLHAMNFILGCHPGANTASFASGVGARSLTTAYGFNRADWSYVPGGIGSGTALIRPDYPELLTWPYLWQQTEYVLGGGTTDYLFLILAADHELNKKTAQIVSPEKPERFQIAEAMDQSIRTELLNKWYPQSVDSTYGGFLSTYTYDFKPTGTQDKFIVTQARHTWSTAKAAEFYPGVSYYLKCSQNGFRFLRDVMWDKTYGGFYDLVSRQGADKSNPNAPKEAYGNAFAIYALAAYYKASGDTGALSLAKKAFWWLEEHSHDKIYKGYYQHLKRDGTPVVRSAGEPAMFDLGYKDQNSSIHLLEAFTELYGVWKDNLLRERLTELLLLIRDKITTPKGYMILFFKPNWTPVSFRDSSEAVISKHRYLDHVSFGHDVETAYLMLEASHVLGLKNDTKTLTVAKRMVDHALQNGWDKTLGGFYDEGYYFKNKPGISIILESKNWWAQAEGLNSLLMMADRFPNDGMHYYDRFKELWKYVQTYLIDHVNGDWYEEGLDKEPQRKTALKGHIWKGTYHNFRALSNCIKRLRGENDDQEMLPAEALQPFGRTMLNSDHYLELIGSAAHVGVHFEGTTCRIKVSVPQWLDHNYLQYELDGVYQKRVRVSSKEGEEIVITAPNAGEHTVWIYKATEAHTGALIIQSVQGKKVNVLRKPAVPLIEFIGNSITCGAAADPGEVPCGTGVYHDQHNAYMAYGPRLSRALGVNYIMSSASGIGIYRNWNSDGPTMPQVYEKTDFQLQGRSLWNFSTYDPDIVSIALGTNDFSKGDGTTPRLPFDSAAFVDHYVQFVQLVKGKYPAAQIALLSSPMVHDDARTLLQNCLTAVKIKIDALYPAVKPVALFFFEPMQARGCTGHPNVEDHAILANELLPFFKKLLQ